MNTCYWPTHTSGNLPSLVAKLGSLWQAVLSYLDATSQPRVWQVADASGHTLWNAYDPISQLSIDYASADELSTWLEELHYRD
jgi:hypothetical protein